MSDVSVMKTTSFLDTLGVCTHIAYTDGGYANIDTIKSDLAYLGIHEVRDGISNGQLGSAPLSSYIALAASGIKFTICFGGGTLSSAHVQADLDLVAQLNTAVPGCVIAVEGPNEINNWPVVFNGTGGLDGALALQSYLYASVHADPRLSGVAVDYLTGYAAGSVSAGPDPSTTPGLADYDTQHPYPQGGQAPRPWVDTGSTLRNEPGSPGPFVYTETGYSTYGHDYNTVNEDVQAKYSLDLLFDAAQEGSSHTFLYQLMDAYAPGSPQGDDGYGLFNPDKQPKAAATAIHNLTTILADTGSAGTGPAGAIAYSVTGLPTTGHTMALANADGTFDIAVWNEPQIWDPGSASEIAAATVPVTVQLGATYSTVSVYDPMLGTGALKTYSKVSAVPLGLTDHPLILKLGPVTTSARLNDTLVLSLSEDAYQGDAQFTVSIDGKQIGKALSVTALRSAGQSQNFVIGGNFGTGPHTVGVTFLNDAWGGTRTTDRNLFVKSIQFDGTTTQENALQARAGTARYALGAPASAVQTARYTIAAGTALILDTTSVAAGTPVTFAGSGGVLQLTDAAKFQGSIAGFGQNDTLDLTSIGFSGGHASLAYSGTSASGTLSVSDGVHSASLAMVGAYGVDNFSLGSDGHGGSAITFVPRH